MTINSTALTASRLNVLLPRATPFEIHAHPQFGLTLRATHDIPAGIEFWRERPAFVLERDNADAYVPLIMSLRGPEEWARLLGGDFQSMDEAELAKWRPDLVEVARKVHRQVVAVHSDRGAPNAIPCSDSITRLVSTFAINALRVDDSAAALFTVASKAAHSCAPNTVHRVDAFQELSLLAVKPICAGDLVTISYVGATQLAMSRRCRTEQLLFDCSCTRCCVEDGVRRRQCPLCGKGDVVAFANDRWLPCNVCKKTASEDLLRLPVERSLESRVVILEKGEAQARPAALRALLTECTEKLGQCHWSTIFAKRLVVEQAVSASDGPTRDRDIQLMLRDIIIWFDQHVSLHAPDIAANTIGCYRQMLDVAGHRELGDLLRRQLAVFGMVWGADDMDVLRWQRAMHEVAPRCAACGTASGELQRCARCKNVAYCSRKCQAADWRAGHKVACAVNVDHAMR